MFFNSSLVIVATTVLLLLSLSPCESTEPMRDSTSNSAAQNLQVTTSSYLSGADGNEESVNEALTVGMDNSGQVFVGGAGPYNYGLTPVQLDRGGSGFVLVLTEGGSRLHKLYRYGSQVSRVVVRESGTVTRILVQSDKGLVLFNGNLDHVLWNKEIHCPVGLCYSDLGSDGTVAVVIAGEDREDPFIVRTFDVNGTELGSAWDTLQLGDVLNDIAVDPVNKQVIIAGYKVDQTTLPCVLAFDYTVQNQRWHDYCVSGSEESRAQKNTAIHIQRMHYSDFDNKLYMTANSHGGNMVLLLNPVDINNNNGSLVGLSDMEVNGEPYTWPWGFHGHHVITYVARYNPKDGALEASSFYLPRFNHEDSCNFDLCVGNSVSADISSGPDGTILVAHNASQYIEHRGNLTINGKHLAPYQGPQEAVLLGVHPDLRHRLIWHHFAQSSGASQAVAVAAGQYQGRTHVAFIAASSENQFVTVNPLPGTGRATSSLTQSALIILEMPTGSGLEPLVGR